MSTFDFYKAGPKNTAITRAYQDYILLSVRRAFWQPVHYSVIPKPCQGGPWHQKALTAASELCKETVMPNLKAARSFS